MSIPSVFVSYSHDSLSHKKWVLDLATRLRNSGVDATIDQWDLQPGDDLPHFMETNLASCDRVLMVCSENYVKRADAGKGGVGYEKMIITSDLLNTIDSNKVIPIVRQRGTAVLPTFLKTKLYIDFSQEAQYEFSFDELLRAILDAPVFKKPPIGDNPFDSASPERSNDALLELMRIVVEQFEQGDDPIEYENLVGRVTDSRVMLDLLINEATAKGYITREYGYISLNDEGKFFAIEHDLVDK